MKSREINALAFSHLEALNREMLSESETNELNGLLMPIYSKFVALFANRRIVQTKPKKPKTGRVNPLNT